MGGGAEDGRGNGDVIAVTGGIAIVIRSVVAGTGGCYSSN